MRTLATVVDRCGVDWMRVGVVVGDGDGDAEEEDGTTTKGNVRGSSSSRKTNSSPSPSPSPLGEAALVCTMARLVAGELRISLGSITDDERDAAGSKGRTTVEYCIRAMVTFLHVMIQLAEEEDDSEDAVVPPVPRCTIPFNTDAVLHMRHTFEDALDAVVQFLSSYSSSSQRSSVWDDCSHRCCRFLGAYLSEIDIWERHDDDTIDDDDNDDEKFNSAMGGIDNRARKGLSSVQLLIAVRRGLAVCVEYDCIATASASNSTNDRVGGVDLEEEEEVRTKGSRSNNKASISPINEEKVVITVVTLCPCLIAILTSCRERQQQHQRHQKREGQLMRNQDIQNAYEHLVKDDVVAAAMCATLNNCLHLLHVYKESKLPSLCTTRQEDDDDVITGVIFETLSWCNLVIESFAEFHTLAQTMTMTTTTTKPDGVPRIVYEITGDDDNSHGNSIVIRKLRKSILSWVEEILVQLSQHSYPEKEDEMMALNPSDILKFINQHNEEIKLNIGQAP